MKQAKATFAAGCFWGVEATFRKVPGINSTRVGYTGGHVENPSYHDVCTGKTGHAEAVNIHYDQNTVSYEELLAVFWGCHNPTLLDRQGADIGSQYRSAIFFHDANQQALAQASKAALEQSGEYSQPVVTEITFASIFYPAEEYHQCYLEKKGKK